MSFRLIHGELVSDRTTTTYDVSSEFERVLRTLDTDEIPNAFVALGILTEQARPSEGSLEQRIDVATKHLDEVPAPTIPEETVDAVEWLLAGVNDSLDPERKQTIGDLLNTAGLNRPGSTTVEAPTNDDEQPGQQPADTVGSRADTAGSANPDPDASADSEHDQDAPSESSSNGRHRNDEGDGDEAEIAGNAVACDFCDATFASTDRLISHAIQCDDRPDDAHFECEYCGNAYVTESALDDHLDECTETSGFDGYECDECGKTFDTLEALSQHQHASTSGADEPIQDVLGRVTHYDRADGYGFIYTSDLSEDVFFHVSQYPGQPSERDQVRFTARPSEGGYEAESIVHVGQVPDPSANQWDGTFSSERPQWGNDT